MTIMGTSSIDLPVELTELILSKCPAKSVIRFKSVSRSWQSIISSRRFSRVHHTVRSKVPENQNKFLMSRKKQGCYSTMRMEGGKFETESSMVELEYDPIEGFYPMSSCNGLILLSTTTGDEYKLWNPHIRKHVTIRALVTTWRDGYNTHNLRHSHLYHDSVADDYKIARVYRKSYTVYSCKSGRWGVVRDLPCGWDKTQNKCVDGCVYSMMSTTGEIEWFDFRDGKRVLKKVRQPEEVGNLTLVRLKAVSGRLCLYGINDGGGGEKLHLWVMEKNKDDNNNIGWSWSWKKLIGMEKGDPLIYILKPVCLSSEDNVTLLIYYNVKEMHEHVIYTPNCTFNQIHDHSYECNAYDRYFPVSDNIYLPS